MNGPDVTIGFVDQPWIDQAACRGTTTPDLWFPEPRHRVGDEVRTICRGCPVRFECLDYSLRWNIQFGVWGGLTYTERRRIRVPPARRLHCQAGHAHVEELVCLAVLVVFIVVGLRLLGLGL